MAGHVEKAKVYFLPWESLSRLPELLELSKAHESVRPGDLTAVKIHFGERGGDGHIKPENTRPILQMIRKRKARPFLTDTGTIYHGDRENAVGHLAVAADHGFTQTRLHTPIIIADGLRGDDCAEVEIEGEHFKSVKIATSIVKADSIIAMSHFKGHLLAGFGGAIKNLGMGCGARLGKFAMHSGVSPSVDEKACTGCGACVARCAHGAMSLSDGRAKIDLDLCVGCGECIIACDYRALTMNWNSNTAAVQERFAEYAAGAVKGKRAFYVNFVNHVTPNCDCMGIKEKPLLPDIGILASSDPVAIDQASHDLVCKHGGDVFKKTHPRIDSSVQLSHAVKMKLGSREYRLIEI
ncbi:MAG TPA: DUF362 domain-containing protein [bacterium]|nr:DUF362 domain-containing protein [bacterium]